MCVNQLNQVRWGADLKYVQYCQIKAQEAVLCRYQAVRRQYLFVQPGGWLYRDALSPFIEKFPPPSPPPCLVKCTMAILSVDENYTNLVFYIKP